MKRSKFSEEQIIAILRVEEELEWSGGPFPRRGEAGAKTAEICRGHGSEAEKQMIQ